MRYPIFLLICLFTCCFCATVDAQKSARRSKEKKVATPDFVDVYYKKKPAFHFTRSEYLLFRDSINRQTKDALHKVNDHKIEWKPAVTKAIPVTDSLALDDMYFIYRADDFLYILEKDAYRQFRDSVAAMTKDTLFVFDGNRVEIHGYNIVAPSNGARRGPAVFVNKQGYVSVILPLVKTHQYRVVFFADALRLFEINPVKETELVLDKTNFVHAGWFRYELFDGERMIERNKFFLPK